jgi:hypothetical protein
LAGAEINAAHSTAVSQGAEKACAQGARDSLLAEGTGTLLDPGERGLHGQ